MSAAGPAAETPRTTSRRFSPPEWWRLEPLPTLGLVCLAAALCRLFWLARPRGALIFDEKYYVNACRVILGWHVPGGAPYAGSPAGLDPNTEHPPLGKLIIAGSMRLFGDNAYGWRLPSVVFGLACIVLLYLFVRAASGDAWLAVLAATVLAFDNLVFVHSRIATLDIFLLAFLLLGCWVWAAGWPLAGGAALGISTLVKLGGVYGCAALVLVELGRVAIARLGERRWDMRALRSAALIVGGFFVVWFGGLWLLDLAISPYHYPWQHVEHMVRYGFSLRQPGGPVNEESNPWQWLVNDVQMTYLRVNEDISANGHLVATRPLVYFRGAMNPVVIGTAPLAFAYSVWRAWRLHDRLSIWVVAWIVATYFSFYPLVLISDRTTYIFYALPALPAVAVAIAQLLRQARLPGLVAAGYVVGLLVAFAGYFPFRRIL